MVDDVRVLRLLRSISHDLDVLRAEGSADDERRTDPMWLRGVKYSFVTAVEAVVDIAQHVSAAQGWGPPRDNGDAVRLLGGHGVIGAPLAEGLRRAVGFRDVLVHEHVAVDDGVVVSRLDDLSDLEAFVQQVAAWMRDR